MLPADPERGGRWRDHRQVPGGIVWKVHTGAGRPRTRPDHVIADKDYSSRAIRTYLRRRGIGATIPERADQLAGRARRKHRRCAFDPVRYKRRNVVERCFNRLKHFKGIATRYDKLAAHYRSAVTIACLLLWLR
ncbi:transposase [Streptosporangium brasiliense]|uniref:Transposase n=1 Tax=Streptosporangium brasiliense TaxID=47480 RepID=A0ABT9RJ65_9ACTN|nr:transposase [Streptosporangium brasiliense]